MKNQLRSKKYKIALLLLMSFGAASCLNDAGYTDLANGVGNGQKILSWSGQFGTPSNIVVQAAGDRANYDMSITLSSSAAPDKNYEITVVPEIDSISYLANINAGLELTKRFCVLPDSTYEIESETVLIKKGSRDSDFRVVFFPNKINKAFNYMLPLRLQSADPTVLVSGNQGIAKLAFIGNIYAGTYSVDYNLERQNNALQTFTDESQLFEPIDSEFLLVKYIGFSFFGNTTLYFKISVNANNTVNIYSAATEGAGVVVTPIAGAVNVYDPLTKTFTLNYEYLNASGLYRRFTNVICVKQ